MRRCSTAGAVHQGAASGVWDSRQLNSSGSLSEDSEKGSGLPRSGVSTLSPIPDEELLWEEKGWRDQIQHSMSKTTLQNARHSVQIHTFHSQSRRRPCPLIYWCNRCWSAVWLQPLCTWSYREHTCWYVWCWDLTGGTNGVDCPITTKVHEEHCRRRETMSTSERRQLTAVQIVWSKVTFKSSSAPASSTLILNNL